MAHEWNIRPRGRVCTTCSQPFQDGQECVSALYESETGFERHDSCMPCWAGQIQSRPPFSVWQGVFQAPEKIVREEAVRKETAESLLRKLIAREDPALANAVYVLAVMLERSRQLIERDARPHDSGGVLRIYEHRKSGDLFTVLDPCLRMEAIGEVQRQVVELLGAPTSPTPPPTATPPPPK